ncbi:unnamed protein product, partial [Musa hybrid cultivar]
MRSGEWILVYGFLMLDCYMVVALGVILQQKAESTIPIPTFSPPEGNTTFVEGTTWCVARPGVSQFDLQNALDWACGLGAADCSLVQPGAACYEPDTLLGHASYAFNSYYQQNGNSDIACYFGGTAIITSRDPSKTPQSQVLKVFLFQQTVQVTVPASISVQGDIWIFFWQQNKLLFSISFASHSMAD